MYSTVRFREIILKHKSVQNIHSNYLNSICSVIAWRIKRCVVPYVSVLYFKDYEVKHCGTEDAKSGGTTDLATHQ
jgi:hypothetical protein